MEVWGQTGSGAALPIKGRAALPRGTVIAVGDAVTNAPPRGNAKPFRILVNVLAAK
jgi:hypothetical protein